MRRHLHFSVEEVHNMTFLELKMWTEGLVKEFSATEAEDETYEPPEQRDPSDPWRKEDFLNRGEFKGEVRQVNNLKAAGFTVTKEEPPS